MAHEVHRRHFHAPAIELWRLAEAQGLDDEPGLEVPGVGGSTRAVTRDVAGAVHTDRQPAPGGLPDQLLGDPLGLAVAVLAGSGKSIEVYVLLAQRRARREDTVGGDVVHRLRLVEAGQAQDLAGPVYVGGLEPGVRVD